MTQPGITVEEALKLAMQQHQAGQVAQAEAIYRQILAVEPNQDQALHLAGVAAHQLGRGEEAIELLRRAIRANPSAAHYHSNFGQIFASLGRFEDAASSLRTAIGLQPEFPDAYHNLGLALQQLNRPDEAAAALRQAIVQRPNFPAAWNMLGAVLQSSNKSEESIAAFQEATKQQPDFADAFYNLGHALRRAGKTSESVAAFRKSLELNPSQPDAHNSAGVVLYSAGDLDEALSEFHKSLKLKPDFAEAHNNVGLALQAKGQYDGAAAAYRAAIAVRPDYATAHHNLSTVLLAQGDFENGWAESEWRWRVPELGLIHHDFNKPLWDGSELKGKHILLYSDQALGDAIQFLRYAPMVVRKGGIVRLAVPPSLRRLAQGVAGIEIVRSLTDNLIDFDVHCPLATLPLKFSTTLSSVPDTTPYLFSDPGKIRHWRERLAPLAGLKVGLVWAGRPEHGNDHNRSIPLSALAPLAEVPNITWISLQKGKGAEQLSTKPASLNLHDFTNELADFSDTAALVDCLDLVISVDTSTAHLAGALGKAVWVMLPFVADWRWLLNRTDSPWYASMRLFRQPKVGDWSSVVQDVAGALAKFKAASA